MRIAESKLRRIIRKAIIEHVGDEHHEHAGGSHPEDEAIIDYFEEYAEIFAEEALGHEQLGPALLANDNYTIGMYIGQLDSFSEYHDQLRYDGVEVGLEHLRQTLKDNGFFDMVAMEAQKKNSYQGE